MHASMIFARAFAVLRRSKPVAEPARTAELTALWSDRARRFGRRCVYDLSIPEAEFDAITAFQERELYPLLNARLTARPKHILDYGCGAGRFTASLRALTQAKDAVGFDLCPELIELAQIDESDPRTRFRTGTPAEFFRAHPRPLRPDLDRNRARRDR